MPLAFREIRWQFNANPTIFPQHLHSSDWGFWIVHLCSSSSFLRLWFHDSFHVIVYFCNCFHTFCPNFLIATFSDLGMNCEKRGTYLRKFRHFFLSSSVLLALLLVGGIHFSAISFPGKLHTTLMNLPTFHSSSLLSSVLRRDERKLSLTGWISKFGHLLNFSGSQMLGTFICLEMRIALCFQ